MELKGICKSYAGREVLHRVDIKFRRSQLTVLDGASGAGKSTLLYLLGLLEKPSEGSYRFGGKQLEALTEREAETFRAKTVSFVFQENNLLSGMSVVNNIRTALLLAGIEPDEEEIGRTLRTLGIGDLRDSMAETLSGGEKQRLTVAIALLKRSEIILADEPTAALDKENAENIFQLLSEIKGGRDIVLISHDKGLTERYADRVITLTDGAVTEDRSVQTAEEAKGGEYAREERGGRFSVAQAACIGASNFKRRWRSLVFVWLSLVLAVTAALTMANVYVTSSGSAASLNAYYEMDRVNIDRWEMLRSSQDIAALDPDSIAAAAEGVGIAHIAPKYGTFARGLAVYLAPDPFDVWENGFSLESMEIEQFEYNDFYLERMQALDIIGELPKNANDILLSETKALLLTDDPSELVGKTFYLREALEDPVEVRIAGINRSRTSPYWSYNEEEHLHLREILTYCSTEVICSVLENGAAYWEQYHSARVSVYGEKSFDTMFCPVMYAEAAPRLLYGSAPQSGQIVICAQDVYDFLQMATGNSFRAEVSESAILAGELPESMQNILFTSQFYIGANSFVPVTVSGICEEQGTDYLYLADGLEQKIFAVEPIGYTVYAADKNDVNQLKEQLSEAFPAAAVSVPSTQMEGNRIAELIDVVWIMLFVSVLLVLLALVLVYVHIKTDILQRRYEIGLLRSWGAGNRELLLVFLFDALLLCGVSLVAGVALGIGLTYSIPLMITSLENITMRVSVLALVLIVVLNASIAVLSSLFSLWKARKLSPRECILTR